MKPIEITCKIIVLSLVIGCTSNNRKNNTETFKPLLDTVYTQDSALKLEKELLPILEMPSYKNFIENWDARRTTTSRMNKMPFMNEKEVYQYHGSIHVLNKPLKVGPTVIADVAVSFSKLPWYYSDTNQIIDAIFVKDKSFCIKGIPFNVDDSTKYLNKYFDIYQEINDSVILFSNRNIYLAVKSKNSITSQYFLFQNDSLEYKKEIIINYLSTIF
ncbi:MAG: hypothetical protein K9J13_12240 [Saprospiraceae bacterium]|nr:hypothetical protein [Saprospiraceae bacterium]